MTLFQNFMETGRAIARQLTPYRQIVAVLAIALFAIGTAVSAWQLGIDWRAVRIAPLMIIALCLAPASLLYGAVGMKLLADVANVKIPLGKAMAINVYATLGEALPLPGGAMVRTAALVKAGSKPGISAALVVGTAALWIAMAGSGAGMALIGHDGFVGWLLTIGGLLTVAALLAIIVRLAGLRLAALTLLHRLFGLALVALRISAAFAAFSIALSPLQTMPFALASIAGSAASVAPAGLGISEALAALVGTALGIQAAAAFLAVALNRIIGLASTTLIAGVMHLASRVAR